MITIKQNNLLSLEATNNISNSNDNSYIHNAVNEVHINAITEQIESKRRTFFMKCQKNRYFWICGCNQRNCKDCMSRRRKVTKRKMLNYIEKMPMDENYQFYFITLTFKNVLNFDKEYFDKKRKLTHPLFRWLTNYLGENKLKFGYYGFECTHHEVGEPRWSHRYQRFIGFYSKLNAGYHLHIHALIYANKFDKDIAEQDIGNKWLQLTGDSFIVNILSDQEKLKTKSLALDYILKYIGKSYNSPQMQVYLDVTKKRRMFHTFGGNYASNFKEELVDNRRLCYCDSKDLHYLESGRFGLKRDFKQIQSKVINKEIIIEKFDENKSFKFNDERGQFITRKVIKQSKIEHYDGLLPEIYVFIRSLKAIKWNYDIIEERIGVKQLEYLFSCGDILENPRGHIELKE